MLLELYYVQYIPTYCEYAISATSMSGQGGATTISDTFHIGALILHTTAPLTDKNLFASTSMY